MKKGSRPPSTPTPQISQLRPVGMSARSVGRSADGKQPKGDHSLRIVVVFLLLVALAIGSIFYFSSQKPIEFQLAMMKFSRLREIYQQEGFQKFLEAKETLKHDISHVIDTSDDEAAQNDATNVAVYLFPESWQRMTSKGRWLLTAGPRRSRDREITSDTTEPCPIEELRANIWNYENPEHSHPNLSATAKEVIRIYEELSAP